MGTVRVREDSYNKKMRERARYTKLFTINAQEFADRFERDRGYPLVWSRPKLDSVLDLIDKGDKFNDYPKISYSFEKRKLDVLDGRHRIAGAALRGMRIEVAAEPGWCKFPLEIEAKEIMGGETLARQVIESFCLIKG